MQFFLQNINNFALNLKILLETLYSHGKSCVVQIFIFIDLIFIGSPPPLKSYMMSHVTASSSTQHSMFNLYNNNDNCNNSNSSDYDYDNDYNNTKTSTGGGREGNGARDIACRAPVGFILF